ncbi:MAG: thiamine phosphate synthase [Deltaproteobacteria bacterium]|nr:thiamine phosphate synthase [Deltaproteobacteria bacterium]
MHPEGLYPIIDTMYVKPNGIEGTASAILGAGVEVIQLRAKLLSTKEYISLARLLRTLANQHKALFIVNDRVDIALVSNADGVHLGQDDMPVSEARTLLGHEKIIGLSTHNLKEVEEANALSPDYISFGPIFPTRTKKNAQPAVGIKGLIEAKKRTNIPIVAIGGIPEKDCPALIKAGATAISMVSEILLAPDIAAKALSVMKKIARS